MILAGCTLRGGGVDGFGGDGLVLFGDSIAWSLDTTLEPTGIGVPLDGGGLVDLGVTPRSVTSTSPIVAGQPATLTYDGVANDLVAIGVSTTGAWIPLISKNGAFGLGSPFPGLIILGTAPTDSWDIPFVGPNLPAGIEGQTLLLQVFAQDGSTGDVIFGGSTVLVLVE